VAGGRVRLRITSALGPLSGKNITVSPDVPAQTPWQFMPSAIARRMPAARPPGGCSTQTDADGRATLTPFPPGPAEVRIPLINSTYVTRVTFSERGPEMVIEIPDGLIPVKAIDDRSHTPISNAQAVWIGGGGRVETLTNANGDALLEAPGAAGGTLTLSARDYETLEGAFPETPGTLQEVAMTHMPSDTATVRVQSPEGKPLAGAVVRVSTSRAGDADEIAMTGADGAARFLDLPPGSLRAVVRADGYEAAQQAIAAADRAGATIALTRTPQY